MNYLPTPNDTFSEDIPVVVPGRAIISQPCQIWKISVKSDTGVVGVVSFSDNSDGYNSTYIKDKVYLSSGQYEIELIYPHGLKCTRGLSAIASNGSCDVFVSYD